MRQLHFIFLAFFSSFFIPNIQAQLYDLNFESASFNVHGFWEVEGTPFYRIAKDSMESYDGNHSMRLEYKKGDLSYKTFGTSVPIHLNQDEICIQAAIKTKGVDSGYAGIWMRAAPNVAAANMDTNGIKGTTDWELHTLCMSLPNNKASSLSFGGVLVGNGTVWIDDIKVFVNGEEIAMNSLHEAVSKEDLKPFRLSSEPETNAISNYIKLWGFLKYFHPNVAKGKYDWDAQFIEHLKPYLSLEEEEKEDYLLQYIISLGDLDSRDSTLQKNTLPLKIKTIFPVSIQEQIKKIHTKRFTKSNHHYVRFRPIIGNPIFRKEAAYGNTPYPNASFRLLALARLWNVIAYFYPYKELIDKDWDLVLDTLIPLFLNAENELEYEMAVLKALSFLQDSHAKIGIGANKIKAKKGRFYVPIKVQFIQEKLLVTDVLETRDQYLSVFEVGDVISHIDKQSIKDMVKERIALYPGANKATIYRDMAEDMLRSNKDILDVYLKRGTLQMPIKVQLYPKKDIDFYTFYPPSKSASVQVIDTKILYINLQNYLPKDFSYVKEMLEKCESIIIDSRNYPQSFVPFTLGSLFVSQDTPFATIKKSGPSSIGSFQQQTVIKVPQKNYYTDKKIVVLVNQFSQSQAEFTIMAFEASKNSTVIGSTTAGSDGNVSSLVLPGGLKVYFSGIGIYYPNGDPAQKVGVRIDHFVQPSIKGIEAGVDEVLEYAKKILNK